MTVRGGKGTQLQMFMTPKEIQAHYQPLDGDRGGEGLLEPEHSDWLTNRSVNSDGDPNVALTTQQKAGGRGKAYERTESMESDSELWDRKLAESQMDPIDYAEARGDSAAARGPGMSVLDRASAPQYSSSGSSGSHWARAESYIMRKQDEHFNKSSLYDSVREGGVQAPVHLGSQFGVMGKPQVVGGHHRIAAAADIDPNQPIPVLHHADINDARSSSGPWGGYS